MNLEDLFDDNEEALGWVSQQKLLKSEIISLKNKQRNLQMQIQLLEEQLNTTNNLIYGLKGTPEYKLKWWRHIVEQRTVILNEFAHDYELPVTFHISETHLMYVTLHDLTILPSQIRSSYGKATISIYQRDPSCSGFIYAIEYQDGIREESMNCPQFKFDGYIMYKKGSNQNRFIIRAIRGKELVSIKIYIEMDRECSRGFLTAKKSITEHHLDLEL